MMQYDRNKLNIQAKEYGFVRDIFEKVCRLSDVLAFFEGDPLLSSCLALKGGTAINLAFFDLPRLSVDIDLDYSNDLEMDYANSLSREKMLAERKIITERIMKYMSAQGYVLSSKTKNYHALDSLVFEYTNAGGVKDNLKIETNYMNRCHVLPLTRQNITLPWSDKTLSVLCVDPIEIYSTKTVALMNRAASRDLYDMSNMVKAGLIDNTNKEIYKKCVMFYSAVASEKVPDNFNFEGFSNITSQKIKTQLIQVLRHGDNFKLNEAIDTVKTFLSNILVPSEQELQFWNAFERGDYKPELLFESPETLSRIRSHPMALWKCRNNANRTLSNSHLPSKTEGGLGARNYKGLMNNMSSATVEHIDNLDLGPDLN